MIWIIGYLICSVMMPFIYIFIEYKGIGKMIFYKEDFAVMAVLTFFGPFSFIPAIVMASSYGMFEFPGIKLPDMVLDISKWVGKKKEFGDEFNDG